MESIPLSVPNLKGNEGKYVADAIEQEWVSTGGTYITLLERELAAYLGTEEAVAVQSGTAALHLALLEAGVGHNDLVIAPTLTFIAAVNPIRYAGADPVFMDCGADLCMDAQKLACYLGEECEMRAGGVFDKTLNRRIKAILVVHVFGNIADMEAIMSTAATYGLSVIEDATEALGSHYIGGVYAGKMAGTIGDYGAFSFNGNKIITTGGGGMLVARHEQALAHMRYLSTQAKDDTLYFVHHEVGYNYRMTNLQAALGVAQLEQLEGFIAHKTALYEHYLSQGIPLLPYREDIRSNHWFFSYMAKDRDRLIRYLADRHIQTRPVWKLNHWQTPYLNCRAFAIETALRYYDSIVNLPCSSNLPLEDAALVAKAIKEFETRK